MTASSNGQNTMLEGHEAVCISALLNGMSLDLELDDFCDPVNRTIFESVHAVDVPDLLPVQDELRRRKKLTAVGGAAGLTALYNKSEGLGRVSIDHAFGEVREASCARRTKAIGELLDKGDLTAEEAIERLSNLGRPKGGWRDALDSAIVTSSELAGLKLQPRKLLLAAC